MVFVQSCLWYNVHYTAVLCEVLCMNKACAGGLEAYKVVKHGLPEPLVIFNYMARAVVAGPIECGQPRTSPH